MDIWRDGEKHFIPINQYSAVKNHQALAYFPLQVSNVRNYQWWFQLSENYFPGFINTLLQFVSLQLKTVICNSKSHLSDLDHILQGTDFSQLGSVQK